MQTGDTHFEVEWSPRDESDNVDDALENRQAKYFGSFQPAARFACEVAGKDFFGVAVITHRTCENAKYNWWSDDWSWHAEAPCSADDLDADNPDTRH